MSAAATPRLMRMSLASALPAMSPRDASARIEIGFTFTNHSSGRRQRLGLDEDVRQERQREDRHEAGVHHRVGRAHDEAEGREDPRQPEREHDDERERRDHAADAGLGVEAEDHAEHDDHRAGDEVADAVAQQRADERRRAPDRQRADAVHDAAGEVRVERDARVHGREQHGHHERAREDVLQVLVGGAGDRAAEDVREHQDEHHRGDGHVQQLLGDVLDLQHPAPGEGHRGRERARRAPGAASRPSALRIASSRWTTSSCVVVMPPPPRARLVVGPAAVWPVRARNTSSRLGWPSEKSAIPHARIGRARPRRARRGRRRRTSR